METKNERREQLESTLKNARSLQSSMLDTLKKACSENMPEILKELDLDQNTVTTALLETLLMSQVMGTQIFAIVLRSNRVVAKPLIFMGIASALVSLATTELEGLEDGETNSGDSGTDISTEPETADTEPHGSKERETTRS